MSDLKNTLSHTKNSALISALFLFWAMVLTACSPSARSLFFDIPEPTAEPEVVETQESPATQLPVKTPKNAVRRELHPHDLDTDRPAIEEVNDWESALEMLPKDAMGQPDWGIALRDDVIKPRALNPQDRDVAVFKLDFFLKSASPMFDAYFPHSAHLDWMGCDSCHPAIFKYRDNEISMATINQGQYCGACHGKVAFPATSCKRCHTNM